MRWNVISVLVAALVFFLSSPSYGDTGLGYFMIMAPTPAAPLVLAPYSYGLASLGVVIIEWVILKRAMKWSWLRAFLYSLLINIASTIVGIVMGAGVMAGVTFYSIEMLLLPVLGIYLLRKLHPPGWFFKIVILSLVVPLLSLIPLYFLRDSDSLNLFTSSFVYEIPLIFGFGLTLIVEGSLLYLKFKSDIIWKAILYANIASYLMLLILFPIAFLSYY